MTVIGVDVSRGNWIAVASDGAAHFSASIAEIARSARDVEVVAIDIPIGLPSASTRPCDEEARRFVGPRRSSVFLTPTRSALSAPTHADAIAINRSLTGKGISAQAYGLRHRILEVDAWLADAPCQVIEVHPEVSFRTMAGRDLAPKWTWTGALERFHLLTNAGFALDSIGVAGRMSAVDDVLDAAAAAWSAARFRRGEAVRYPAARVAGDDSNGVIWA